MANSNNPDLGKTLKLLQAYRKTDPDFEQAIEETAAAEARLGNNDPAEGTVVTVKPAP